MEDESGLLSEATLEEFERKERERAIAAYEVARQVEEEVREQFEADLKERKEAQEREHSRPATMRP